MVKVLSLCMCKLISVVLKKNNLKSNLIQADFCFVVCLLNCSPTFAQVQKQQTLIRALDIQNLFWSIFKGWVFHVLLERCNHNLFLRMLHFCCSSFCRSNDAPATSLPAIQHATGRWPALPGAAATHGNDGPS